MKKLRDNLIYLLPTLICFDSYCFFYLKTLPITLSFVAISLIFVLSLFCVQKVDLTLVVSFLILIVLVMVCGFLYSFKITSALLYIFFFLVFLLSRHRFNEKKYHKSLKLFLFVTTIFSIIAIFQMASNFINIPRFDIVIPNHMVVGFNRSNVINIGSNLSIARSNGLFLEPSFLSQFCVIAFVIAITLYKANLIKKHTMIISIIINAFGLLFSFAGTGILLLVIFLIVYWFKNKRSLIGVYILLGLIFVGLITYLALPANLKDYLLSRIVEVGDNQKSGGMRFSYPYYMVFDTLFYQVFGFGCGNEGLAMSHFYPQMVEMSDKLASGYAKIGVELGVAGLFILLIAIFKCDKHKNVYLFSFLFLINFLGGNLLNTYFWCFMLFLNYDSPKIVSVSCTTRTEVLVSSVGQQKELPA